MNYMMINGNLFFFYRCQYTSYKHIFEERALPIFIFICKTLILIVRIKCSEIRQIWRQKSRVRQTKQTSSCPSNKLSFQRFESYFKIHFSTRLDYRDFFSSEKLSKEDFETPTFKSCYCQYYKLSFSYSIQTESMYYSKL